MYIRVISWLLRCFVSAFSLLCPLLWFSCAQPTDSTDKGTVERERVEVSGSIPSLRSRVTFSEDTVWESGKEDER